MQTLSTHPTSGYQDRQDKSRPGEPRAGVRKRPDPRCDAKCNAREAVREPGGRAAGEVSNAMSRSAVILSQPPGGPGPDKVSALLEASPSKCALMSGRRLSLDSGSCATSGSDRSFLPPSAPGADSFDQNLSAGLMNNWGEQDDEAEDFLQGSFKATSLPLEIPARPGGDFSPFKSHKISAKGLQRAAVKNAGCIPPAIPTADEDWEETDRLTPLAGAHSLRVSPKDSPHSDRPPRFSDMSPQRDDGPSSVGSPNLGWGEATFAGSPPDLPPETYALNTGSPARQKLLTRCSSGDDRRIPGVKILSDFAGNEVAKSSSLSRLDKLVEAQSAWLVPLSEVTMGETLRTDAFGIVKMGRWRGTKAIIRTLNLRVGHELTPEVARELLGELACPLRHPNLALHMGTCRPSDATGEIVTIHEYLSEGNVADFALRGVDVQQACSWTLAVARMLCFLHSNKPAVVVGQLRPTRLLVDTDMHVKLCDVELQQALRRKGIALKLLDEDEVELQFRTCDAPEIDSDTEPQPSADIYSAGVIALMLLLGKVPSKEDIAAVRGKRLRPFAKRDTVMFGAVVGHMVAEDPSQRPSSSQLVKELEECSQAIQAVGAERGGCAIS